MSAGPDGRDTLRFPSGAVFRYRSAGAGASTSSERSGDDEDAQPLNPTASSVPQNHLGKSQKTATVNIESRRERMTVDAQALFDEKDYTGTYPYAPMVIGPYTPVGPNRTRLLGAGAGVRQAEALCGEPAPHLATPVTTPAVTMILASEPAV